MNKSIKSVALLAVLSTMAVGCQKETFVEPMSSVAEIDTTYTVTYTIDGVHYQKTLIGEQAWSNFLQQIFALAEQGHEIRILDENFSSCVAATKDVATFSSSDKEKAYAWCTKMYLAGYLVTISYDEEKKVYNCTAVI